MIAAIVTRHEWTRNTDSGPLAYIRQKAGSVHVTFTAHTDPNCAHAKGAEVVVRDVPLGSREAGWPCSYCIPIVSDGAGGTALSPASVGRGDAEQPVAVPIPPTATGPVSQPVACPDPHPARGSGPLPPWPKGLRVLDRVNRYAGECPRCGQRVGEQAGRLGKLGDAFVAVHKICAQRD